MFNWVLNSGKFRFLELGFWGVGKLKLTKFCLLPSYMLMQPYPLDVHGLAMILHKPRLDSA